VTKSGTKGTTSPRLGGKEPGGGGSMSQLTRSKDLGQEASNRGGLVDRYRIKSYK
jgi:hypothetical protein